MLDPPNRAFRSALAQLAHVAAWMIIFAYYNVIGQCLIGYSARLEYDNEMKPSQSSRQSPRPGDHLNQTDALLLEEVADKLVRFGQRVGVTPEEMVSLLDSGISIDDRLAFLVSKRSGAA